MSDEAVFETIEEVNKHLTRGRVNLCEIYFLPCGQAIQ